ncbi:MAG: phosphoenolpyruvate carboxykinase (ATP) [Alphaproteobacteria bacterium]
MENLGTVVSSHGLEEQGLTNLKRAYWNLSPEALVEEAIRRNEGKLAKGGAFMMDTGIYTGRSPQDRFVVEDETSKDTVDWGKINQPISPENFERLYNKVLAYYQGKGEVFVRDVHAGADETYQLKCRFVTVRACHNMFINNMFLTPTDEQRKSFAPDFTVLQCPELKGDEALDGIRQGGGGTFIVVNFSKRMIIIGGTEYSGEMKKGIFGVLNYILPERGIMPMHCSANIGDDGKSAVFFGLSGTGKTTLSADPSRTLIGDDEHAWSEQGVSNFEGGCYAKVINLDADAEPIIFKTTQTFGTILENIVYDENTRVPDLFDGSKTENTRSSYPITQVPNATLEGKGPHPSNVVMLTCDAFGVLPPISRLSAAQASYQFISGYTAKVAGTERGITEPQATFSSCFGSPFMPRRPAEYAALLGKLIEKHGANCWLVNTGWSAGAYGVGSRMKLKYTRALLEAALNGELNNVEYVKDEFFGLEVPTSCPGLEDQNILMPKNTWADKAAYDATAKKLAGMFEENFKKFEATVTPEILAAAIKA